jgi:hypothetical protein
MSNYKAIQKAFKAHAERRQLEDVVPDEWFTARDWAAFAKINLREAQRAIRSLLDDCSLEVKAFKIKTGTRIYPVTHYKICNTTTKK